MDAEDDNFVDHYPYGDEGHTYPGRSDRPKPSRTGWSAKKLWNAAGNCKVDIVEKELENDCIDIEQVFGYKHTTALFQSVSTWLVRACPRETMQIASMLIRAGADPLARSAYRMTPLHAVLENCMGTGVLRMILREHPNLNVNVREQNGRTPLLSSIYFSDSLSPVEDDVIALLDHGADPRIPDIEGNTILHMCTTQFILNGVLNGRLRADINARNQHGQTPLFNNLRMFTMAPDDNDIAYNEDGHNQIRSLMKRGADARIPDNQGNTIFHLPLDEPTISLIRSEGFFHIDINALNNRRQTALHIAVEDNSYERVCLLLRIGVDFDIRDSNGETAEEYGRRVYPPHNTANIDVLYSYRIERERALAIAMATHARLGDGAKLGNIEHGLIRIISELSRKS
jgi:ankyrin repeat protein